MKQFKGFMLVFSVVAMSLTACKTFHSGTYIPPKERFELGNNTHNGFKARVTNASTSVISLYHAPINGGTHSPQDLAPGQTVRVRVDKNTALFFKNPSADTSLIKLAIRGDLGLSMGYK